MSVFLYFYLSPCSFLSLPFQDFHAITEDSISHPQLKTSSPSITFYTTAISSNHLDLPDIRYILLAVCSLQEEIKNTHTHKNVPLIFLLLHPRSLTLAGAAGLGCCVVIVQPVPTAEPCLLPTRSSRSSTSACT